MAESPQETAGSFVAGVAAVTATFFYFLLFAQFGFIHLLTERGGDAGLVQGAMAAMGLAGIATSLLAAMLLKRVGFRRLLQVGFLGCSLASLAALSPGGPVVAQSVAAAVGAATALVTVTLAARLRKILPPDRLGLGVGLGTGLAYCLSNLPYLFSGSGTVQAVAASMAGLVGLAAVAGVKRDRVEGGRGDQLLAGDVEERASGIGVRDVRLLGFVGVVSSFLVLVWLDSAAFMVIQETAHLKGQTWAGPSELWRLGTTHLLAAVAAGIAFDRGFFRSLLNTAFGLFVVAFTALGALSAVGDGAATAAGSSVAGSLYAIGISLYSVALVVYPSGGPAATGLLPRRWRSAILFGVAGWIGSAMGVGMAQNLHHVPRLFLAAAAVVLIAGAILARPRPWLRLARDHGFTLGALGIAALALSGGFLARFEPATPGEEAPGALEAEGRRIYIAEGCMHCHSQYVRPLTSDVAIWGPARPLDRTSEPPLPGNRRQGPDLSNAGLRRSALWHQLHLKHPRSLMTTSVMPSYAHLFEDGDRRGEALVAYLASLGAGDAPRRWDAIQGFEFSGPMQGGSVLRGGELFARHCIACHGDLGRGDGIFAEAMRRPAMDLTKGPFWLVSWGPGAEPLELGLARLVKFGMAGTSMPGHELLSDSELADLVAFVLSLQPDGSRPEASLQEGDWP